MSDKDKQEAAEKAKRAGRQARHAASNIGDAAEAAAEHVKDEIVDGATEAKEGVRELATKAVYTEAGRGVLAVVLGAMTMGFGFKKLSSAKTLNDNFRKNLAKADHHIRPSN